MAAKVNDTVIYHPGTTGRPTCEARITAVNADGTVNIAYPHFADSSVEATADSCQWGIGVYQVSLPGDEPLAAAAAATPAVSAPSVPANITAKIESLEAQVERLTQELASKAAALVAAGADDAKVAVASVASFVERFGIHPDAVQAASVDAPAADDAKAKK